MASFSIVHNVASANAQANLTTTHLGLNQALQRLSSGLRINQSGDDAAGLAVANGYRSDAAMLSQGIRNGNDGLSQLQIQDSALNNISKLIDRLGTLATQAASGTATNTSRATMDSEFQDILGEITRESAEAGLGSNVSFSVFISNSGSNGTITGTISAVTTTSLSVSGLSISSAGGAGSAVAVIASAVSALGTSQGQMGSLENRLQFAITLAQSEMTNKSDAEGRIRDANIAEESANMTKYNILQQSGIAALAQANSSTASVLALLR
jgi:flagellin